MDEQVHSVLVEVLEILGGNGTDTKEKVTQEELIQVAATIRTVLKIYTEVDSDNVPRKPGIFERFKV